MVSAVNAGLSFMTVTRFISTTSFLNANNLISKTSIFSVLLRKELKRFLKLKCRSVVNVRKYLLSIEICGSTRRIRSVYHWKREHHNTSASCVMKPFIQPTVYITIRGTKSVHPNNNECHRCITEYLL